MNCNLSFSLIAAVLVGLPAGASRAAIVYDPSAQFSPSTNNATSSWSYRYRSGTTLDGNYQLLTTYGDANGTWSPANPGVWKLPTNDGPEIGKNLNSFSVMNVANPTATITWQSAALVLRPEAGQLAVVSWLYPFSEPFDVTIDFTFSDLESGGGDGGMFYVDRRNTAGTRLGVFSNLIDPIGGMGHGNGTYTMLPGDRIDFIIDPLKNAISDSTRLSVMLTVVPEPSAFQLGFCGCAVAAILLRKVRFPRLF